MHRRHLLTLAAALPALAATRGLAGETLTYAPGVAEAAMEEGKVILLTFKTDWCSTCAAQERVLGRLRAQNPAYNAAITFIDVDYDVYGQGELALALNVPRRSTLILLKGREVIGRIVAATGRGEIGALLDLGVAAAAA